MSIQQFDIIPSSILSEEEMINVMGGTSGNVVPFQPHDSNSNKCEKCDKCDKCTTCK